jgi:hypothetical protein
MAILISVSISPERHDGLYGPLWKSGSTVRVTAGFWITMVAERGECGRQARTGLPGRRTRRRAPQPHDRIGDHPSASCKIAKC